MIDLYHSPIPAKPRVLVFVVAFHAEATIVRVLTRIPLALLEQYDVDVLVIDDSSRDETFEKTYSFSKDRSLAFNIRIFYNPVNLGYGGNQKLGYEYAIQNGYDFVVLLHGDGQYAPESLPELLEPLRSGEAAAVFGSRMMRRIEALRGGMPLYKYVGNRILTWAQNRLLRSRLTEFHSGYRAYSVEALRRIPFARNSNDFHFDTEIIIQLMIAKLPIKEVPIPTYYGDEICRVNGLRYAKDVMFATLKARLQELSLFYDRRYDCAPRRLSQYSAKFSFNSPHTFVVNAIAPGSRVLDLGCAGGYMGHQLKAEKQCSVTGVDAFAVDTQDFDDFYLRDLNAGLTGIPVEKHDIVLLLDVIEHLASPEAFLEELRSRLSLNTKAEVIISTGNIAFLVTRLMLLLGQFNYGPRGILDITHTRLFTFASLRRLLDQAGFQLTQIVGMPVPFPLALGDNMAARFLVKLNTVLCRIWPTGFSYQILVRAKALPTVASLLRAAQYESQAKADVIEAAYSAAAGK